LGGNNTMVYVCPALYPTEGANNLQANILMGHKLIAYLLYRHD